ncbi:MAG: hypothetical protein O3B05_02885 [archaeon]|nr:hypothetical protein [archaeon]
MVTATCPHCESDVDLPDGAADVFTCLKCGGQFGYLPDEGEGMEAEVVPLAPDPMKDLPDDYERKVIFGFKLGATILGVLGGVSLVMFLFLLFLAVMLAYGLSQI